MIRFPKSRCKSGAILAALVVGWLPLSACGDEFSYIPDNAHILGLVDLEAVVKTKTYDAVMKKTMDPKNPLGAPLGKKMEEVDKQLRQVARITAAAVDTGDKNKAKATKDDQAVVVFTTIKPTSAAEVKAWTKPRESQLNFAFKEIKHGTTMIYQETWDSKFKKEVHEEGEAFFIAEGKYVVTSHNVELLKKLIDRKKPAVMSESLKAGLKAAKGSSAALVLDFENFPAAGKDDFLGMFKFLKTGADIKGSAGKVKTVIAKVSEAGDMVKLTTTLLCDNPAGAAAVKAIADKTMVEVMDKLKEPIKLPGFPEPKDDASKKALEPLEKMIDGARKMVTSIKIVSTGRAVIFSTETPSATALETFGGLGFLAWVVVPSPPVNPPEKKEAKENEKKTAPPEKK